MEKRQSILNVVNKALRVLLFVKIVAERCYSSCCNRDVQVQNLIPHIRIIFKKETMSNQSPIQLRKYDKIDIETRKKLVQQVIDDERPISKAAKKYGIKLSTAKVIVKRFKINGTFFESKREQQLRVVENQRVPYDPNLPSEGVSFDLQGSRPVEISYSIPNNWSGLIFHQAGLYFPVPSMQMSWPVCWRIFI